MMCSARAINLKRNIIHVIGTVNMSQIVPYTRLESDDLGSKDLPPLNIGYYQNQHFVSLVSTISSLGDDPA